MESKKEQVVRSAAEHTEAKRSGGDWFAKIFCLLIAFVIWFYVMLVDSTDFEETFYSVDVVLTNTAVLEGTGGLSVYSGYGTTVDVTVIGKKSTINKLTGEDLHVTADVSAITEAGMHSVPVQVELPSGLSLGSLSQGFIQVYADEKSTKVVDVRAKITSFTMEHQLQMGEPSPAYDTVVVTGPKNALNDIAYAQVSLALGNVSSSMTASGTLVLIDENGVEISNPYLRLARTEVKVDIPVYTTKTLPLTVEYKYGYFNDTNVRVTLNPAVLSLRGDPATLEKMNEIIVAMLDEKQISGDITQMVPLSLPAGVTAADGTENVVVTVNHVGTHTRQFTITDIDVTGAVGMDCEIMTASLNVMVRGTLQQLAQLKTSDFTAIVDLSGYTAGSVGVITEKASILIDSVYADNVYEIGDYSVKVKLN